MIPTAGFCTTYQLQWEFPKELDFDVRVFELSPVYERKLSTNGDIIDVNQLTPLREFKNGKVEISKGGAKILGLVFISRSKEEADFYVAPHSTEPGASTLDFKFTCLCYHHAYHMKKGFMWYRILKLSDITTADEPVKTVYLKHKVVLWNKSAKVH
jgi:hypothetical protein